MLFSIVVSAIALAQQAPKPTYDGHWWVSITSAEQSGFLDGYFDCYTYAHKGTRRFAARPPATLSEAVTNYYRRPAHLDTRFPVVFEQFRNRLGETFVDRRDEMLEEPHGYYNGALWREMSVPSGPQLEQIGYVEGYLSCRRELGGSRRASLSRRPAAYVTLISRWYRFDPVKNTMDPLRERRKIADVLSRFRDRAK